MVRVVFFDWGNTVMRVFPEWRGPMVDWPVVSEMPGAREALAALKGRYRLVLVTNAADSTQEQVAEALERVGLRGYFDQIFTSSELGARKPQTAFYENALRLVDCRASEAMMVGDNLEADVLAAQQVGLRVVWYNSIGESVMATGGGPDAVIKNLEELPEVVAALSAADGDDEEGVKSCYGK